MFENEAFDQKSLKTKIQLKLQLIGAIDYTERDMNGHLIIGDTV